MGGKRLKPVQKIAIQVLAEQGKKDYQIAQELGISENTAKVYRDKLLTGISENEIETIKKRLANKYAVASDQLLEAAFEPQRLAKMSSYQAVVGSSIMIDKHRLLSGESTSNVSQLIRVITSSPLPDGDE